MRIAGVVAISDVSVSVISNQPEQSAEPQKALAILQKTLNEIMRHALFERDRLDSVRRILRRKLCAKQEAQSEQTAEIFKSIAKHIFASKPASW